MPYKLGLTPMVPEYQGSIPRFEYARLETGIVIRIRLREDEDDGSKDGVLLHIFNPQHKRPPPLEPPRHPRQPDNTVCIDIDPWALEIRATTAGRVPSRIQTMPSMLPSQFAPPIANPTINVFNILNLDATSASTIPLNNVILAPDTAVLYAAHVASSLGKRRRQSDDDDDHSDSDRSEGILSRLGRCLGMVRERKKKRLQRRSTFYSTYR